MWVLQFDLVDQINSKIAVHGLITQYVLVLLGGTNHFVLTTECQNLRKAYIEEQTLHQAGKNDQRLQQRLIGLRGPCVKVRVHDRIDVGDQKLIFVPNGLNLLVSTKDLALV